MLVAVANGYLAMRFSHFWRGSSGAMVAVQGGGNQQCGIDLVAHILDTGLPGPDGLSINHNQRISFTELSNSLNSTARNTTQHRRWRTSRWFCQFKVTAWQRFSLRRCRR